MRAVSAFFTTLIVGALLVAFAPDYTERMIDDVFEDPVGPFLYGIMILLILVVLIVLLVISIIGTLFVIPLAIIAGLALSGIGGLISFVFGALGFGTILDDRYN
ncbi:hypothetical protein [Halovenus sp. HT40]|uniref:hypothetical protein n=1 Tax=Halovenus sp. HT40 TaxID=3126691 RepID=UPI00300EE727